MAETWRVVLASGEVREVSPEHNEVQWCTFVDGYHGWGRTQHASISAVAGMHGWPVVEILAPGEPTRAELAAQHAAVTAERDVLRAQQAPLLDAHDALVAAARAAGWTGAGATGAELVAWVRRGEREACAARCDAIYTARDDAARRRRTHGSRDTRDEDCVRLAGQAQGAAMCAEALREGGE